MEDALVLSTTSKTVTIVHWGSSFRASVILSGRVMNHRSINIKWNHKEE
jgi:thioredoxin reductase